MDLLVHFSPKTIIFEFLPNQLTTTQLHVRNVSEHRVAYKVKTTDWKRYCVRPNAAIIEPEAQMHIELTQQAMKHIPEDLNDCRDRFLLQVARVDLVPPGKSAGPTHGYESVMDFWEAVPPHIIYKAKFGVFLKMVHVSDDQHQKRDMRNISKGSALPTSLAVNPDVPETLNTPSILPFSIPCTSRKGEVSLPDPDVVTQSVESPHYLVGSEHEQKREKEKESPTSKPFQASVSSDLDSKHPGTTTTLCLLKKTDEIDYTSVQYTRERALGIRTARKEPIQSLDEPTRQRIAVERAGELKRTINSRQKEINVVSRELSEAGHKLNDARTATGPAYDVKYEVSDNSRVPYAQIAIMAIISGALLQLLV